MHRDEIFGKKVDLLHENPRHLSYLSLPWLSAISEFSMPKITHPLDRMAALHGLTEVISASAGNALGSYKAGIWKNDLLRGLLFEEYRVNSLEDTSCTIKHESSSAYAHFCPPSWSWTSTVLDGSHYVSWNTLRARTFIYQDPQSALKVFPALLLPRTIPLDGLKMEY